jgi:glutathione S-transferase
MSAATTSYKIVGDKDDYQVRKILIAAKFANINLNRIDYDILSTSEKSIIIPSKLPALLLSSTLAITQANAILRFIARKNPTSTLYGETPEQSAQVDQWIDYVLNEVETCAAVLTYPLLGVKGFNPSDKATLQARKDMFAALRRFDEHLLDHMYLVFDQISVADVAAAAACINVYKLILTAEDRDGLRNITRWFYTCVNQPQFKDIIGVVSESPVTAAAGETKTPSSSASASSSAAFAAGDGASSGGAVSFHSGPPSTSPAVVNVEFNTTLENGGLWRRNRTRLREIICRPDGGKSMIGTQLEVAGWIKSLQKNMRFLQLGDGSCANTLQIVMDEEMEGMDGIKTCGGQDACIRVIGKLVAGRNEKNPVEIKADKIIIHGKKLSLCCCLCCCL